MGRFRKRPLEVEAVQYTGRNWDEIDAFVGDQHNLFQAVVGEDKRLLIRFRTIDGNIAHVGEGDWIVRGVKGELYPCRADIFAETFELVLEATC